MARRLRALADHTVRMQDGQGVPIAKDQILPPRVAEWVEAAGDPDLYEDAGPASKGLGSASASDSKKVTALTAQLEASQAEVARLTVEVEALTSTLDELTSDSGSEKTDPDGDDAGAPEGGDVTGTVKGRRGSVQ